MTSSEALRGASVMGRFRLSNGSAERIGTASSGRSAIRATAASASGLLLQASFRTLASVERGLYDLMMITTTFDERRRLESLDGMSLAGISWSGSNSAAQGDPAAERVLRRKVRADCRPMRLHAADGPLQSLDELARAALHVQGRAAQPRHPGDLAANLTYPHRAATRGFTRPRARAAGRWWCSTRPTIGPGGSTAGSTCSTRPESKPGDCVLMAFSFGPFIGFWSAYDAACARGCLVVPGGGMSTLARLELLRTQPGDGRLLHAQLCPAHGRSGRRASNRRRRSGRRESRSWPASRAARCRPFARRIEDAWKARVIDHGGATEVGPWGYGDPSGQRAVRQRKRVHRRVSLARDRRAGRRRRTVRTGAHEPGPRRAAR